MNEDRPSTRAYIILGVLTAALIALVVIMLVVLTSNNGSPAEALNGEEAIERPDEDKEPGEAGLQGDARESGATGRRGETSEPEKPVASKLYSEVNSDNYILIYEDDTVFAAYRGMTYSGTYWTDENRFSYIRLSDGTALERGPSGWSCFVWNGETLANDDLSERRKQHEQSNDSARMPSLKKRGHGDGKLDPAMQDLGYCNSGGGLQ